MDDLNKLFSERFKKFRELRGFTQTEIAEKLGFKNYTTISKWESGKNLPRGKELKLLAEILNVSSDYLMGLSDSPHGTLENVFQITNTVKIPVLGEIACGEPILAEENIEGYMDEVAELLPTGTLFYLHCKGDSMEPTIRNGSYVLVRQQPEVEDGEIAAVLVNGNTEATLKRVKHQGNIIMLMPDNPTYSPYIITPDNPARIVGKALEVKFKL